MLRNLLFAVLLSPVVLGCRSREAPAVSTGATAPADADSSARSADSSRGAATESSADVKKDKSTPPAKREPALRDVVGRLLKNDGQGGWYIDEAAATELESLAPQPADLLGLLKDPVAEVRRGAAYSLQSVFNPAADEQVAAMMLLVEDEDRMVRSIGLALVRQMRLQDQVTAAPRLATLLDPQREDKPENRASVARFLGGLKSDAAEAFGGVAKSAASDPDARVRAASLAAAAQIGQPSQIVTLLVKALSDNDASVRVVAAARLRQQGAAAAEAAQPLAAMLSDEQQSAREAAAETLIRIGTPAVGPLIEQLQSPTLEARKLALFALAGIGPTAKEALPAIERCKNDPDEDIRKLAALAATRVGGQ